MSSVRLHQILLVAALVLPGMIFWAAAWQNQLDVRREGLEAIERTAAVMQEHARKVFETAELAIRVVDERIDSENWDQIASPATTEFLRRLKAPIDQIAAVWIADATGAVRAGSAPWPQNHGTAAAPAALTDRGTVIGAPSPDVPANAASFTITRRFGDPPAGTIQAAISPSYFARFYAEVAPNYPHVAMLVREDGAVLAMEPQAGLRVLTPRSPLMRRIGTDRTGGLMQDTSLSGAEQIYAFRPVGQYPVFVVFAVPEDIMMQRWYRNLRVYAAVGSGAALTLLVVSWLALRRAQAEEAALEQVRQESAQRQAAEQQLRHAQRLDAVGQLTGGVAHDFNNLLTAILGNLELIERSASMPAGAGTERIRKLAITAKKAVQRGSSLTKSLLAFSRKQPLQPRTLDASALLGEFVELVRQAVGGTVEVVFDPGLDVPPCFADPAELEAAVLNLAINARDAMPKGGVLRIRMDAATLTAAALAANPEAKPGRFVVIEVADTGSGMPPDVAAKAFEPFFTTKPVGQGTGLGLSQVFGFVRQLGGHVTLHSTPGRGTTIRLFLPVQTQDATSLTAV